MAPRAGIGPSHTVRRQSAPSLRAGAPWHGHSRGSRPDSVDDPSSTQSISPAIWEKEGHSRVRMAVASATLLGLVLAHNGGAPGRGGLLALAPAFLPRHPQYLH